MVAHGGHTEPPLFRTAMTSSTFLPSQYNYDDDIPEVRGTSATLGIPENSFCNVAANFQRGGKPNWVRGLPDPRT